MKVKSEVAQSRPTLSDAMDCSLPGSSVHGIFQARVLEWGAIAFSAYGVSTALFRGKWCNELNSDETQNKRMVKYLNAMRGKVMLEKTWRIFNLKVEVALMSNLCI